MGAAEVGEAALVSLDDHASLVLVVERAVGGSLLSLELLVPPLHKLVGQILDGDEEPFDLSLQSVSHPDGTLHVPLLLVETLCINLLEHQHPFIQVRILSPQIILLLLDIRYRLESVIDQLGAHYGLALRLLFEGVRIFELFLQLADFLVELADLFS